MSLLASQKKAIALLSYNHPEITSQCIDSVLRLINELQIEIPVILHHNGSQPKHVDFLKSKYPQLIHLVSLTNLGYTRGVNTLLNKIFKCEDLSCTNLNLSNRNQNLQHIQHNPYNQIDDQINDQIEEQIDDQIDDQIEEVLFLTNDTELISMDLNPVHGFQSITLFKRKTTKIDSVMGLINLKSGLLKHLKTWPIDLNKNQAPYVPGTAFWIDRLTWQEFGPLDETFHTYWEDVDLGYRIFKKNKELKHNEATSARHKIGKTCHKDRFYTYELFQRNRGRFMTKHQLTHIYFYLSYFIDVIKYSKYDLKKCFRILTTFNWNKKRTLTKK